LAEGIGTIAKFLYCSSVLEEKVAYAYRSLAERVDDSLVRSLLLYISTDSLKHSIILRAIGEELVENLGVKVEDCENILGEVWRKLTMLAMEEIIKEEKVENEELISLANKMASFESFVGEEYLTTLHLKVSSLIADELEVDLGDLKDILKWIVEDEERHEKIITMLRNIVSKRKNEK
jgi:rubrerythrin